MSEHCRAAEHGRCVHTSWSCICACHVEPARVLDMARRLGITRVTWFGEGLRCPEWPEGVAVWASYRDRKDSGASGPYLGDFEAAVLIASGVLWEVADALSERVARQRAADVRPLWMARPRDHYPRAGVPRWRSAHLPAHARRGQPDRTPGRAAVNARVVRLEALPEHTEYRDTGCEVAPSCLSCPLPQCRYDVGAGGAGIATLRRRERAAEIRARLAAGQSGPQIAEELGVSLRTVWRAGKTATGGGR